MTRPQQPGNTATITRNSLWYVLDASAATLVMLLASVPVARVMGPTILGHYIYLVFLTSVAQRVANLGISATACKYMAEYLGAGQKEIAHGIYRVTFRQQAVTAIIVTAVGCVLVQFLSDPAYRLVSFLIVLSMWPSMVNSIPAQANVASENLRANIPASFINFVSYSLLVVLTLVFEWGLIGLACATLVSRSLEAVVRYWGVRRWLGQYEPAPIPSELRKRMLSFSRGNLMLLLLGLVVWDRSEIIFLKHFCTVREVAFYSLAFSIVNQLLMVPRALSSSIGYTMFAQFGRDSSRLEPLMQNATRYVALLSIPLFLGLAAVCGPLIRLVYGATYAPVIPVMSVMSVFAIVRALQLHTESVLQAMETHRFMVKWLAVCAAANLLLDWLVIPSHGAIGAAAANGVAQTLAVGGLWVRAVTLLHSRPPLRFLGWVFTCGTVMVAVVLPIGWVLPPPAALAVSVAVGGVAFGAALRASRCLEAEDRSRLNELSGRLPAVARPTFELLLRKLMPRTRVGLGPVPVQIARD